MDFGRPLLRQEGVASKSNIRIISVDDNSAENGRRSNETKSKSENDTTRGDGAEKGMALDRMLIRAANKAATDLFLGPPPHSPALANNAPSASLYPERLLDTVPTITPGSLVVIFESFDNLNFVYATRGSIFHNRNGQFHHDDFIGKPFGCKIRSRDKGGLGFVYLLRPTPELWCRSLNHRTQIVHELDASAVVFYLDLRPNMVVCESGTGSGAMSHAILRTIAPRGTLHTYEFNRTRVEKAREEFERNGVDRLVTVHYRDVCGKPRPDEPKDDEDTEGMPSHGGFGLGPAAAHAVFLDLPEPWLAVPHAAHVIRPNGRLGSYSPCVEQAQKAIQAMGKCGFHSIRTIEVRSRENYVREVELEAPPRDKLIVEDGEFLTGGVTVPTRTKRVVTEDEAKAKETPEGSKASVTIETSARDAVKAKPTKKSGSARESGANAGGQKKRKMLCAVPFATMRGHTAFLTFAIAGNRAQPEPNANPST